MFNYYILMDGALFLLIGIIVLITPSPQPALTKKVNQDDLLPFAQTRQLLASMFIASALLLLLIGYYVKSAELLKGVALIRITSFLLVITLNYSQLRSKRWKAAPLLALISIFTIMAILYVYFIFTL